MQRRLKMFLTENYKSERPILVRMWVAKIRYRHDCILGNRCKKFEVALQSLVFSVFKEKGEVITSSLHCLSGQNIEDFIDDLKKDKSVLKLERKGQMFLLLEKAKRKAVRYYHPKLIQIKPVLMGTDGFETWEVGSWERKAVEKFVNQVRNETADFQLIKFRHVNINDIYFPKILPNLTLKQKKALDLAIAEGYYKRPKQIGLRQLAKMMKVSLATYQQHLQTAEQKIIPQLSS